MQRSLFFGGGAASERTLGKLHWGTFQASAEGAGNSGQHADTTLYLARRSIPLRYLWTRWAVPLVHLRQATTPLRFSESLWGRLLQGTVNSTLTQLQTTRLTIVLKHGSYWKRGSARERRCRTQTRWLDRKQAFAIRTELIYYMGNKPSMRSQLYTNAVLLKSKASQSKREISGTRIFGRSYALLVLMRWQLILPATIKSTSHASKEKIHIMKRHHQNYTYMVYDRIKEVSQGYNPLHARIASIVMAVDIYGYEEVGVFLVLKLGVSSEIAEVQVLSHQRR